MTLIRSAQPSEDVELSRILCNAFLPIWNHNWFQGISEPLAPVPVKGDLSSTILTPLQSARVHFYFSLIKSTRLLGGEVLVNVVENASSPSGEVTEFGAILLWLPPRARMTITTLSTMYYSGFLRSMYDYGITGIYRIVLVFETNIERMFKAVNVHAAEHDFVEMLASNPAHAGKGLASELLRWRVEKCPGNVVMDTTTDQAQRAYERMGFRVLGNVEVQTGCDALGIRLKKGQEKAVKHVQRVLMLRKGDYIP